MIKVKMRYPISKSTTINYYITKYGGKVLKTICGGFYSIITFFIDNYNDIHPMTEDFGRAGCDDIIILKVKEIKKRWWNK